MVSAHDTLTYRELDTASNRVAHTLIAHGVVPGTIVAVLADQGLALITAQLGVLKAGAAFVPLDPRYPAQRNAYMLGDTRAPAIVTHAAHRALAESLAGPDVAVLDMQDPGSAQPTTDPGLAITPDMLAYVLYTSGSTGRPKGVMQPHRSVLHNARRHRNYFKLTPNDRQSLLYPCSVYGGTRDIYNALLSGASLHHYPLPELGHAGLADWLRDQRVTIYCSVVTVFRHFARTLDGPNTLPDIRLIKLGGEAPFASDIALFREHFARGCTLFCGLGSTEAGMARRFPIDHDTPLDGHGVPLGYAVDGVEVLLLDPHRKPVATGTVGEIAIRSRYITTGYFGRDDLNAERFITCPGSDERVFLTGDLGVMDEQGLLVHKGRNDHQVKIHGNRVELLEVEAALSDHPGVRDAIVVARENQEHDQQLVAYVVFTPGEPPDVTAIRDFLRPRLPRFALPGIYVPLVSLPQTPNGKADRLSLPDFRGRELRPKTPYLEPHTEAERVVAALFERVLGVDRPGMLDHFFDLGGDSLSAVDLLLSVEKELGSAPPLTVFYTDPTPRAIARQLTGEGRPINPDAAATVRLNNERTGPTLFVLAGKGGSVMCMRPLAERLSDRQVVGVQYPGVADGGEPCDDIHALAHVIARRIRKAQPDGPYRLLGYSFGGLVAYETARTLMADTAEIASLVLLDTVAPGARQPKTRLGRARVHLRRTLAPGGWRYPWQQLTRQAHAHPRSRHTHEHELPAHPDPQDDATARFLDALRQHARACERAAERYRPGPYTGPITLIRSTAQPPWRDFYNTPDDYGWSDYCDQPINTYPTPGQHLQLFEHPHVTPLANTLARHI